MSYLVSVVVPTKNRYIYLKELINLVVSFGSNELELVIQDNSDNNTEIVDYLSQFDTHNIKYCYCQDKLTMSENADLAIRNSTGKYVCFIGDDDGVCRNIVDCVKWMEANNIDAVTAPNANYTWGRKAILSKYSLNYVEVDSNRELSCLLKKGMTLSATHMPLIYHGIVKRCILDKICSMGNTLFPACPPDIAGAIALCSTIKTHYELSIPVIINGTSNMTGGGVISKGGVLKLTDVSFIDNNDIEQWDKRVPPIWCGHYAWANSGIKALKYIGRNELIPTINMNYCLAGAIARRPYKKELYNLGFDYTKCGIGLFIQVVVLLFQRFVRKLQRVFSKQQITSGDFNSIIEAEAFFISHSRKFDVINNNAYNNGQS